MAQKALRRFRKYLMGLGAMSRNPCFPGTFTLSVKDLPSLFSNMSAILTARCRAYQEKGHAIRCSRASDQLNHRYGKDGSLMRVDQRSSTVNESPPSLSRYQAVPVRSRWLTLPRNITTDLLDRTKMQAATGEQLFRRDRQLANALRSVIFANFVSLQKPINGAELKESSSGFGQRSLLIRSA
jgi:hypothetical protein